MIGLISKNHPSHNLNELLDIIFGIKSSLSDFESKFSESVNAPYAIAFPRSRVAIRDTLNCLKPKGSDVHLSAYTCLTVPAAIVNAGYSIKFADIELENLNTPTTSMIRELSKSSAAIIATHLFGNLVDLTPIEQVNQPLLIIEDASLSLNTAYHTKNPFIQLVTVYSFGCNKPLSTMYGGMLVTHNKEIALKIREYRNKTLSPSTIYSELIDFMQYLCFASLYHPLLYRIFDYMKQISSINSKFKTTDLHYDVFPKSTTQMLSNFKSRLGISQLKQKRFFAEQRQNMGTKYYQALKDLPGVFPIFCDSDQDLSHYPVRVIKRDERRIIQQMKSKGIELGTAIDYSLPNLTNYKQFTNKEFPMSLKASNEIINLPHYAYLKEKDFKYIVKSFREACLRT